MGPQGDTSNPGAAPHIVVVGSINMDLVARVPQLPRAGETVQGHELLQVPGGKGANQAVAVAQLGGHCTMIGRVGDDGFGEQLIRALAGRRVVTDHVTVTEQCSSGVALIGVERSGENAITIISGANGRLTPDDVQRFESLIGRASALLLQLEVPLETVERAATLAARHGVLTVLDPAPAPRDPMPDALYAVDILSPNQTEAEMLTGIQVPGPNQALRAALALRQRGARHVVIKLGRQGALLYDELGRAQHVPAFATEVVDTTAAGDAFTAALALGYASGMPPLEAVRFGCAAGTLAVQKLGAQPAMPSREQVERLLNNPS